MSASPSESLRPDPLTAPGAVAPDADFDDLRTAALSTVTSLAGATWTDYNEADPGITILEVLAWGLADAHYRVASRGLDSWPLALTLHSPVPVLTSPTEASSVAAALSRPDPADPDNLPLAWRLARSVLASATRNDAQQVVSSEVLAAGMTIEASVADRCVTLLRRALVRRAALDLAGTVRAAAEEGVAGLPATASPDEVDAATVHLLRGNPDLASLWPDEVAVLVARERDQRTVQTLTSTAGSLAGRFAPVAPELSEDPDGATYVWPPAPDQALRCEPVTGEDYAARARAVPGVRRAWAVAGALPGIAWHGARTVVTDRKGTVTLLVERGPDAAPDTTDDDFLRRVIAEVLGESDHPWSSLGARRLLGDEIGAALVRHHPVTLTGTLHAPAGVEPAVVLAAARARVRAYLNAGRAHPTPGSESIGRGPWPDRPQPASGWQPGEPIPVTELVQALADDPTVLGVSDLHASLKDGPVVRAPARVRVGAALAATGTPTVDGVALAAGDRVLLCGQDRPGDNGVYVAGPGAWPRADDLSTGDSLCGVLVPVADGSDAGTVWAQTGDAPITVGSTPLVWERSERTVLEPTRVVMTTAVTPSGQPRLSGVRLFAGDRVLLTGQADARENGGYVVAVGAWTRAADSTLVTGLSGAATRILEGVDADSTWWLATSAPIEVGVTEQVWVRTSQPQPPSSSQTGDIQVPAGGVPVLAEHDCLQVRLTLGPGADDA